MLRSIAFEKLKNITFRNFMQKYGKPMAKYKQQYLVSCSKNKRKLKVDDELSVHEVICRLSRIYGYKSGCCVGFGTNSNEFINEDLFIGDYDELLVINKDVLNGNNLTYIDVIFV